MVLDDTRRTATHDDPVVADGYDRRGRDPLVPFEDLDTRRIRAEPSADQYVAVLR